MHARVDSVDDRLSFRGYQAAATASDQVPGSAAGRDHAIMVPLLGLSGEVGSLLTEFKKWWRQGEIYRPFSHQVSEEIGDILWYLSNIATKMDLDLEEIARENLAKLGDRWGTKKSGPQLFGFQPHRYDDHFPSTEQLPKTFEAVFRMVDDGGRRKLALSIDGKEYGNKLTDNAYFEDGYRFHDCFHLTLATLLGWSPILRKLFECKRKSMSEIDEVEDGARAGITEEAISAFVYGFAKDYSLFDGATAVEYELLRTVKMMTRQFEVKDRTPHEWEQAILRAYVIWNKLIEHDGGVVRGDASKGTIEFLAPPTANASGIA
jgi:NTP pyrophosphatase (non-canonical NTP hydrolase)